MESGYEGFVAKDERRAYEGRGDEALAQCQGAGLDRQRKQLAAWNPIRTTDAEAGERSRLDGDRPTWVSRPVLMAVPTWRRSGS
jgi:hypothetical protein